MDVYTSHTVTDSLDSHSYYMIPAFCMETVPAGNLLFLRYKRRQRRYRRTQDRRHINLYNCDYIQNNRHQQTAVESPYECNSAYIALGHPIAVLFPASNVIDALNTPPTLVHLGCPEQNAECNRANLWVSTLQ
ncbi:hypothetical protein JKP88DRAFT_246708 [Tribonema minus]|uniref:Uncharacterized protein n=1 Tax=Tribonema minus TaxID=303371 RepID=A0A836CE37_9STRA|nr:hypothetical protein JKP88DRAFT_246708 [Tribonema minus]